MEHRFKTWHSFFKKIGPEEKNFEIRRKRLDEPAVVVGDVLVLEETEDGTKNYTGAVIKAHVGFVMRLSNMPELMQAQGAENRTSIADFEVYGLYGIESFLK